MSESNERIAYRFLKGFLNDDQALVEGWRTSNDQRWIYAVKFFADLHATRITQENHGDRG